MAIHHLNAQSAAKASQVLQENHEIHDITFNDAGFHNHIVHGVLTAYALGAEPVMIQKLYEENSSYQRKPPLVDQDVVKQLSDPVYFKKRLNPNQAKMYPNYRDYFKIKMKQSSWQNVIDEHVFKGDERANVMFHRLFAGLFHPLIHLGFGIEFQQPAIMAEALGQAAIEYSTLDKWFEEVDDMAK